MHDKHVFVHSIDLKRAKDPLIFTGPNDNAALQHHTLNLPVKPFAGKLCHFSNVMLQEHFPILLEVGTGMEYNLVDSLGQHKHVTANIHYSHVLTQSRQLGMLLPEACHYLELSAVYQAALSLSGV